MQSAYGLREAIVVDSIDQEDQIVRDLGAAAAFYLETTLKSTDVVGISSWSAALLAMVESMHPSPRAAGARVVQILGGIGNPGAEVHATQLTRRLANMVGHGDAPARARCGRVRGRQARDAQGPLRAGGHGALQVRHGRARRHRRGWPSKLLAASGNVFSAQELKSLSERGAVGDICLRFFDAGGAPVITPLNDRVIAIELQDLDARAPGDWHCRGQAQARCHSRGACRAAGSTC